MNRSLLTALLLQRPVSNEEEDSGGTFSEAAVIASSPFGYWPMDDGADNTLDDAIDAQDILGVSLSWDATGSVLGNPSPLFDGSSDYVDMHNNFSNATWESEFSFDEFTLLMYCKVSDIAQWTNGNSYYIFDIAADSANNLILYFTRKDDDFGAYVFRFESGNVSTQVESSNITPTADYFSVMVTAKRSEDYVRVYHNGTQVVNISHPGADDHADWYQDETLAMTSYASGGQFAGFANHLAVWNIAATEVMLSLTSLPA